MLVIISRGPAGTHRTVPIKDSRVWSFSMKKMGECAVVYTVSPPQSPLGSRTRYGCREVVRVRFCIN